MNNKPIIIDLDGTLIHSDMLHESFLFLLSKKPLEVLKIPYYLLKGRAFLKKRLALKSSVDITNLPYNLELIDWIKEQKNNGSKIILCTGSDIAYAQKISDFLCIFDDVIASDGKLNLVGRNKANTLINLYGSKNFHYAGNSKKDIHIWKECENAIIVNASKNLKNVVKSICNVSLFIPKKTIKLKYIFKAMRVHQWLKNLLLFAPLVAAHQINNVDLWTSVFIGFISFSLCASAIYLINDLTDLSNDRSHPRKKERPFASGKLPFYYGFALTPLLLLSSFAIAISFSNIEFIIWLCVYLFLTTLYTFILKPIIFLDVIVLAMLFTIRIIAGSSTILLPLSPWILAFSIFLFVSLAIIKRYAELEIQIIQNKTKIKGRGYYTSDASLIQAIGLASGFCSILVFVLYLNSPEVMTLYSTPQVIWLCIPILIYWQSWMWLSAHRGNMHDDPVIFAIKDKQSLISGFLFISVLFLGAFKF